MATIEIFSDHRPISAEVIKQVQQSACSKCEIIIYDVNDSLPAFVEKASEYGIQSTPAVILNGKLIDLEKLKHQI